MIYWVGANAADQQVLTNGNLTKMLFSYDMNNKHKLRLSFHVKKTIIFLLLFICIKISAQSDSIMYDEASKILIKKSNVRLKCRSCMISLKGKLKLENKVMGAGGAMWFSEYIVNDTNLLKKFHAFYNMDVGKIDTSDASRFSGIQDYQGTFPYYAAMEHYYSDKSRFHLFFSKPYNRFLLATIIEVRNDYHGRGFRVLFVFNEKGKVDKYFMMCSHLE